MRSLLYSWRLGSQPRSLGSCAPNPMQCLRFLITMLHTIIFRGSRQWILWAQTWTQQMVISQATSKCVSFKVWINCEGLQATHSSPQRNQAVWEMRGPVSWLVLVAQSPWCRGSSRASPRMQIDTIQEKLPVSTADLNLSQEYPLYMEICKGPCWRRTAQS